MPIPGQATTSSKKSDNARTMTYHKATTSNCWVLTGPLTGSSFRPQSQVMSVRMRFVVDRDPSGRTALGTRRRSASGCRERQDSLEGEPPALSSSPLPTARLLREGRKRGCDRDLSPRGFLLPEAVIDGPAGGFGRRLVAHSQVLRGPVVRHCSCSHFFQSAAFAVILSPCDLVRQSSNA